MIEEALQDKKIFFIEDDCAEKRELESILSILFHDVNYAMNGCNALEYIQTNLPDIILCDIRIPCLNGLELVKKIKQIPHYSPVIIMTTAYSEKEYLFSAIELQIDAYLVKPIDFNILIEKIKSSLAKKDILESKHTILSKREFEIFLDMAQGLKPQEIAQKYDIKPKTVNNYRYRIFDKMGFTNNAQLVLYAVKNNLLRKSF